jgi:GT2 family glycosyltransferase
VEGRLNFICGAAVLVTREFVERVGFMDESFFLYCEEQDWAWRGLRQGFTLAYAPDAVVYHKEGASTGLNARRRSPGRLMQLARSRLLLAWKHNTLACPAVLAGGVFALARLLWRRLSGVRMKQ